MKLLVFLLATTAAALSSSRASLARTLELINESGDSVAIDWKDPESGSLVNLEPAAAPQTTTTFNSFVNHSFVVKDVKNDQMVEIIVAEEDEEQVIVIKKGLRLVRSGHAASQVNITMKTSAELQVCKTTALARLKVSADRFDQIQQSMEDCMMDATSKVYETMRADVLQQNTLLKTVSGLGENFTCADPNLETSYPIRETTWTDPGMVGQEHKVGILHERPDGSRIHIVENFITTEECQAIEAAAAPTLHRGTVADGNGGSRMSESRKAWQAGVHFSEEGDPIYNIKRRIFDYTNYVAGYNMSLPGQEEIMSIQYFGAAEEGDEDEERAKLYDPTTPDRYTPHCDGDCDGRPHKMGSRVATMVMYCVTPKEGGATNFQTAGVSVKPTLHAGVFFSYLDNDTKLHETGFTTHSGCPVRKGTKKIAVQWMRVGVDEENPWDSFDTNTVSKKMKAAMDD